MLRTQKIIFAAISQTLQKKVMKFYAVTKTHSTAESGKE